MNKFLMVCLSFAFPGCAADLAPAPDFEYDSLVYLQSKEVGDSEELLVDSSSITNVCVTHDDCTCADKCMKSSCVKSMCICESPKCAGAGFEEQCKVTCDPKTGFCVQPPVLCDDGNPCTNNDSCREGKCAGDRKSCDDGDTCTTDECDAAGNCSNSKKLDGSLCDLVENSKCYTTFRCQAGQCVPVTPKICDDGNACTVNSCYDAGGCVFTPLNCNDGNICNGTETCNPASGCVAGSSLNCNDGNACTADSCDPSTGCEYAPFDCNDSDACTTDTCDAIAGCQYTLLQCNDDNQCTSDWCNFITGECENEPISGDCITTDNSDGTCVDAVCVEVGEQFCVYPECCKTHYTTAALCAEDICKVCSENPCASCVLEEKQECAVFWNINCIEIAHNECSSVCTVQTE